MGRMVKLLLSFFKKRWDLNDYPLVFRQSPVESLPGPRGLTPVPWFATIDRWFGIMGGGATKEEALEQLRQSFERYRATGKPLPRPGRPGPRLEVSPRDQVCQYEDLAAEFFKRILHLDYCDVFVTDVSSLFDFCLVADPEQAARGVALAYGVDISDIEDGNLVRIFERICAKQELAQ